MIVVNEAAADATVAAESRSRFDRSNDVALDENNILLYNIYDTYCCLLLSHDPFRLGRCILRVPVL